MAKDELQWNGPALMFAVSKATNRAMRIACITVQKNAKLAVGGAGTGRKYKRGKKYHTASAPGKSPARDTGTLASSISYEVGLDKSKTMVLGKVGGDLDIVKRKKAGKKSGGNPDYGSYLETGTKNMAARPWLAPALKKSQAAIERIFKDALENK